MNRERALRYALPSMRALYQAGVPDENHGTCLDLFVCASVERAYLKSELGVFDQDRIGEIAAFFSVEREAVDLLWSVAADIVNENHDRNAGRARDRLDSGALAVVAHRPLFDMFDASRAFQKTSGRDHALFRGKGRTVRTGMPTLPPVYLGEVVRGVPDGPGGGRFTTAERQAIAEKCGVHIATVRRWERDLTEAEFEKRAQRCRKTRETKERKARDLEKRAGRRRRQPGRTAAIRSYALAVGKSERHTFRLCQGMNAEEIVARTPGLVLKARSTRSASADVSDKRATDVSHLVSQALSHVSGSVSDKDPSYPAFSHRADPEPIVQSACVDVSRETPKRRRGKPLHPAEMHILRSWYAARTGKALTDATIRQWRHRRVLKWRLAEALAWLNDHDDDRDDPISVDEETSPALIEAGHLWGLEAA